ncbi:MAG: hypothetical protein HC822_17025, partial [Oscillochloris sp.]|nr:hypothetical protein [Oscillochloris sp.]
AGRPAIPTLIGHVRLQLDAPVEALADFERALLLDPEYLAAIYGRGSAVLASGAAPRRDRRFAKRR